MIVKFLNNRALGGKNKMKQKFRKIGHVIAIVVCGVALLVSTIYLLNYKAANLEKTSRTIRIIEEME